jgi:hypothetical protein
MNAEFEVVEPTTHLVLYDRMRLAVEQCAKVDEAKEIRDKAAALAHYAKQCDDSELDLWMSEIKLRAIAQIAKLTRELEKGKPGPDPKIGASGGEYPDKTQQILAAGLKLRTAERYEQLAAPTEELKPVFEAATEAYFQEQKSNGELATFEGLHGAIKKAAGDKLPQPQRAPSKAKIDRDSSWIEFIGAVNELGNRAWDMDLVAGRESVLLFADDIPSCRRAIKAIELFLSKLKELHPDDFIKYDR